MLSLLLVLYEMAKSQGADIAKDFGLILIYKKIKIKRLETKSGGHLIVFALKAMYLSQVTPKE